MSSPSQERKAECQKQAKEKGLRSGPERRDFMQECVHGKKAGAAGPVKPATPADPAKAATPATPAMPATPAEPAKPSAAAKEPVKAAPPANRQDDCRKQADAKSLRGPDRGDFMRSCMQGR